MAMTFSARMPTLAAQSAALFNFLSAANHSISTSRVDELCTLLALAPDSDYKSLAKSLRAELIKDGIKLGQSHALEALSRMAGFTSYMRLIESVKQQVGEFAREGFLLRFIVTGADEPQFVPYASLPLAANSIIEQTMAQLTTPGEPVFCELRRTPQAVVLEVCRTQGAWFTAELIAYAKDGEVLTFVEFDSESQRTFLQRILRALERGRPGTLALYGAIPAVLAPWHYASFNMVVHNTGIQKVLTNERELFFMFESIGLRTAEVVGQSARIVGSEGIATLDLAWSTYDGSSASPALISPTMLQSLVDRYRSWRAGLSMPMKDAIILAANGSTDAAASHSVNAELLAAERDKRGLSHKALADLAGIDEQDLQRIEKYGYAAPEIISSLGKSLGLDPNQLTERPEGDLGFEVTEAKHLLAAMKNIHKYSISFPDDLTPELEEFIRQTGESLQEVADLVQIQDGVFASAGLEPVEEKHLLEHGQALLDSIRDQGLMLIVARGLAFSHGEGRLSGIDGMPLHTITFRFQPRATAAELAIRR